MADRLNLAVRRNRGRAKMQQFAELMSALLERPRDRLEFASLEETDRAREVFEEARLRLRDSPTTPGRLHLTTTGREEVLRYAKEVRRHLPRTSVLLPFHRERRRDTNV